MKALKIIGTVILTMVPWVWVFTFKQWAMPALGNFGSQMTVVGMALVLMFIGIYLFHRSDQSETDEPTEAANSETAMSE
jgi:hypothetical protein